MKILPKKIEIDKAKSDERKRMIDEGVALAKRIDALRDTKNIEERRLMTWRESAMQTVQSEINQLIEERDNLKMQIVELGKKKLELLDKG